VTEGRTIHVRYSCPDCDLVGVVCHVPARGSEDVLAWMEQTIIHLSADHARRSPGCHPAELKDLWIPVENVERIGDAPPEKM
jgi:hypothetical protein